MDAPKLALLERPVGGEKAIIFIHGGWCQDWGKKDKDYCKLLTALQKSGWQDAIYHLWWDSSGDYWMNLNPIKQCSGQNLSRF